MLSSACSGPCATCRIHYTGGCLAGHGDDDYTYVSQRWIRTYTAAEISLAAAESSEKDTLAALEATNLVFEGAQARRRAAKTKLRLLAELQME